MFFQYHQKPRHKIYQDLKKEIDLIIQLNSNDEAKIKLKNYLKIRWILVKKHLIN